MDRGNVGVLVLCAVAVGLVVLIVSLFQEVSISFLSIS